MWKTSLSLLAALCVIPLANAAIASIVPPRANENGNYGRTDHTDWRVVDPDPDGLNCRMGRYSIEQIHDVRSNVPMNIYNWNVVRRLPTGQYFEIDLTPGGYACYQDDRGLPWLYIDAYNCFVRANTAYVRPVFD